MSNRKIYTDSLAEELKADAGRKWRPSNDPEAELFEALFCHYCIHDDAGHGCEISDQAFLYDEDSPKYPKEWQISRKDSRPARRSRRKRRGNDES